MVRVDVLRRAQVGDPWELLEVKSSTSLKPQHVPDVAVQLWVVRGAGQPVDRCGLVHLDNTCVHPQLDRLFAVDDVTEKAQKAQADMPATVARLAGVLARDAQPEVDIGPHCSKPYDCDFVEHCRAELALPEPSLFDVYRLNGKRRWRLYKRGLLCVDALHAELLAGRLELPPATRRSLECLASGVARIDHAALRAGMASWGDPLLVLDFETEAPAVPRHPGTRPYEQVPFQFSAHLRARRGIDARHHEYLHTAADDPRPSVATALAELARETFGAQLDRPGSVVAYNAGFERRGLKTLADACPEHARALDELGRRLVDPLTVLRDAVYDPGFGNSYSLKAVAPALLGAAAGYGELEVDSGTAAQVAFAELIAEECEPARKAELAAGLRAYCKQDTEVLLRVVEWMEARIAG